MALTNRGVAKIKQWDEPRKTDELGVPKKTKKWAAGNRDRVTRYIRYIMYLGTYSSLA